RHLDDEHALDALEPLQVEEGAAPAEPLPGPQVQLADVVDPDALDDRDLLLLHEALVGALGRAIGQQPGRLVPAGLLPLLPVSHTRSSPSSRIGATHAATRSNSW